MSDAMLAPDLTDIFSSLSEIPFKYDDRHAALQAIAGLVQRAMDSQVCTITQIDLVSNCLVQVACAGCDDGFARHMKERRIRLGRPGEQGVLDRDLVAAGGIIRKYDLFRDGQGVADPDVARKYSLRALLAYPLQPEGQLKGYLNHFTAAPGPFTPDEEKRLTILARHVALIIEWLDSSTSRRRLERLNEFVQKMAEERSEDDLLDLLLCAGLELSNAPKAAIGRLDLDSGDLRIKKQNQPLVGQSALRPGQGITNKALSDRHPIRVDDVRAAEWQPYYTEFWRNTRAELAVPIVLDNAEVRIGIAVTQAPKRMGVLNLESPELAAFSKADEDLLWPLARYCAVLMDKLETDRKQWQLAQTQLTIVGEQDSNEIIQRMLRAIMETLGYDYVNVSLVKPESGRIKTEYVVGIPKNQVEEFKRLADHSLDSNDIQADIVRSRRIEVPAKDDSRFDSGVYRRFGHADIIRVFVPMIAPSDNRVIGTVEAGYRRSEHREHIYEQDIRILKGFIDYVARALERRQSWVLEKIGHEFRSPIVGIRNNASFLQRRFAGPDNELVTRKCDDILTDCEILLSQVGRLEFILGRTPPPPKIEQTLVFRDVIIKTLRQLRPEMVQRGFDIAGVDYSRSAIHKIDPLHVDKARLSQVFYNLLTNAIKYAEKDPAQFAIYITVDETREAWAVKVQDSGIGVRKEYVDRIFEEGFRTPEAASCDVTGAGLGLTIARQIMRGMGGDVRLSCLRKPTEFQVLLPKTLREAPQ
jgi:signal transduction histidine kinase